MTQVSSWIGLGGRCPSHEIFLETENVRLRRLLARAEEAAAARYEILLQESDHRIKNSLQIVASLVLQQARRAGSIVARDELRTAAARIVSVASIHDALQRGAGHETVDLGLVLKEMCKSLQAIAGDPRDVRVSVTADSLTTHTMLAQPIALAVNELVLNALRHAYPEDRTGKVIDVHASLQGDALRVVVADDGCGLPPALEGAPTKNGRNFGMRLVQTLVAQISGRLEVTSGAGTRFTIIAPHIAAMG